MALYEVTRTDIPLKDEFSSGYVIAPSRKAAREAVAHLSGVTGRNVEAGTVSVTGPAQLVALYFEEV